VGNLTGTAYAYCACGGREWAELSDMPLVLYESRRNREIEKNANLKEFFCVATIQMLIVLHHFSLTTPFVAV